MRSALRAFYLGAGLVFLALGVIGAALPLLPTVPFLLLSTFCFARSSERLHRWLLEHPRLGPPIRDWQAEGVISPRAKVLALISLAGSVVLGFVGTELVWARAGASTAAVLVAAFLLSRPSHRSPAAAPVTTPPAVATPPQ